eukprot:366355-Chlamydomonas_euryale.AAC.7
MGGKAMCSMLMCVGGGGARPASCHSPRDPMCCVAWINKVHQWMDRWAPIHGRKPSREHPESAGCEGEAT